jgi:septal ring factor EnvC (AmiA/AmiB activator)
LSRQRSAVRLAICLIAAATLGTPALAGEKEELDALRAQLERLRAGVAQTEGTQAEARDQLRESERAISEANRKLRALAESRAAAQKESAALVQQNVALQADIASRQENLGRLLTLRYLNGEQNYVKLLFSGEDPGRVARELYYSTYISRAQAEFIRGLRSSLARQRTLETHVREKAIELAGIELELRRERGALLAQKNERSRVLARVSEQLRGQRRQVKHLERDESRLSRLVEELAKLIASTPLLRNDKVPERNGQERVLAGLKGSLRLPIKGVVANRFGAQRSNGGPAWKGLFIRSPSGQEVRAVASGRVVFSDWLRGFGNLLIIDHGQDYLTIYGNNESVLKQVGDIVHTGDAVATVGSSGGNMESGLYFEIRHKGKAFDPLRWVSLK